MKFLEDVTNRYKIEMIYEVDEQAIITTTIATTMTITITM